MMSGFGVRAWRLGIRVVRDVEFAVLVFLQGSGVLLLRGSPCSLDGDKFGPRGNLAVDVCRHLGLVAGSVKALVALHVGKQAGVETAAAWAGDASSGLWFEGRVFSVERCLGKVEVEVGLNPCAQVFGRKQVRLLVLPVFAPAVFVRRLPDVPAARRAIRLAWLAVMRSSTNAWAISGMSCSNELSRA